MAASFLRRIACALPLALGIAASASAQLTPYSDRAVWEAALSSRTDLSVYGIAPAGGLATYSITGLYGAQQFLNLGGTLFTSPFMFVIDDGYFTPDLQLGRPASLSPQNAVIDPADETGLLFVLFQKPVTAFGIDYFNRPGRGHFLIAGTSAGETDFEIEQNPNWNFLGYTSPNPFSWIYLYSAVTPGSSGWNIAYDRPSFGDVATAPTTTPEPTGIVLMLTGLAALGAVGLVRRRA